MTVTGGAWWSNLRTLFAVGEGLVPSIGMSMCVCICVCVCDSAIGMSGLRLCVFDM